MKQKLQITALFVFCLAGYNPAKADRSLSDTLEIEQVVVTANKTLVNKKLFKFYSKIILWQRYAAWLRAYRPCIHSQWSVS